MISSKTYFAIEVCVFLASQPRERYVTTHELARQLGLSVSHVENILKRLREHQLVCAMKGPGGGYTLQADVSLVSMWDIASVFETTLGDADAPEAAQVADYELGLEQIVKTTLCEHTLADFADVAAQTPVRYTPESGRFKLKPMAPAFVPKAPNSVFQLYTVL